MQDMSGRVHMRVSERHFVACDMSEGQYVSGGLVADHSMRSGILPGPGRVGYMQDLSCGLLLQRRRRNDITGAVQLGHDVCVGLVWRASLSPRYVSERGGLWQLHGLSCGLVLRGRDGYCESCAMSRG